MNYNEAYELLKKFNQEHILKYYDELDEAGKNQLLEAVSNTDFTFINDGNEGADRSGYSSVEPIKVLTVDEIQKDNAKYYELGSEAIKSGKVGAVLLAGGMGTRLGITGPKGKFDIGLTRHVYIFQRLIENLMDVTNDLNVYVHLFVMTSDKNDEETRAFFREHNYFGYPSEYVHFFVQDLAPATDYSGKVYMESKSLPATSPNGNGGWYSSMARSGMTDMIRDRGIEYLNCFAVDNVLQRIADPVFIGACIADKSPCGAKVISKVSPDEKVGVLCLVDGRPGIVEYYELTDELRDAKDENGNYIYNYGVILNYLFKVSDLNKIQDEKLPVHRVEKKIPYMNEQGEFISPDEPNGYKFESLILDMIKMMDGCLGYEVVREKEFAPIKNMTGIDSVESARELVKKNGIEL